jgi:3-phenylpropionate/trans-cinnamate dioxygenase ferredoxin reductase subunit
MAMPEQTMLIAGAGLAGAKAAEALREEGFEGRVVLVGAESEQPYERPPLSKDYLRGESPREKALVHEPGFYEQHDIELLTGVAVSELDLPGRSATLSSGARLRFDRLLLATGAEPRRLRVPGAELDGIHYLRDLADADAIAARLRDGGPLVVVGGGWIGSEVAASARTLGVDVALVEMSSVPLERVLGARMGGVFAELHRSRGVDLRCDVGLAGFEGEGRVERVRLADGRAIDCAAVVVGVGVQPRTELAAQAGLAVEDGVLVSDRLEASVPGVFAAGDVASAWHPFYGEQVRVEHWANALNQPAVAARAMLGKPASYDRLPYFFSDQHELGMEYRGLARGSDELVLRGDVEALEFVALWLRDGRVVAGMNVNVWDQGDAIAALIGSRSVVAAEQLRDLSAPLAAEPTAAA